MAGVAGKSGGARDGAGRKSDKDVQELRATLNEACPEAKRQAIFKKLATEATKGNVPAAKLLLSYLYGMPPSGDDHLIQEGVSKFADDFYNRLYATYGAERAREIIGVGSGLAAGTSEATDDNTSSE